MSVPQLETLAQQFKDCSDEERLELLDAIQEKEKYLHVLNRFAVSLIEIQTYEDLVWFVAKEVVAKLGFVDCVIYEYRPADQMLVQRAAIGEKNPEGRQIINPLEIPLGRGVTGRVAKSREPKIIVDLLADEDYLEDLEPARSEICVPLVHGDELLGVIDCEDPRIGHFNKDHLEILTVVASLASSKIMETRVMRLLGEQARMLKLVREAVVVTDLDGLVIDCNSAALGLYEYDKDQLMGRHISDLIEVEEGWENTHEERTHALDRKGLWRGHEKIKKGTGGTLIVDISLTPVTDDFGNRVATIGVGRDVTALVEAERELKEKNAMLERKQDALEKAISEGEVAKAASRAKDAFLANTSHELRTPLTGLIGMIDLLEKSGLNAEQKDFVTTAQASAHALTAIIDDILDLAKMEAGKLSLRPQPFNPAELVRQAALTLKPAVNAKDLAFDLHLPPGDATWLHGDPNRIRQILINLLGNAIKFTSTGAVSVSLKVVDSGDYKLVEIAVGDTGVGLSERDQRRIFQRFEQLDDTSIKNVRGAGLGLAISRELAALMGGVIDVRSELGVGSTFTFRAKLSHAETPEVEVAGGLKVGKAAAPSARPLNILVAEDNAINQILVTKLLDNQGWRPVVVENGLEAVEKILSGSRFDLVLMDIRMPVMDGIEATRKIRAISEEMAVLPIVALTANTMDADRKRYLEAGMDAVLGKPIDQELLRETVLSLTANNG